MYNTDMNKPLPSKVVIDISWGSLLRVLSLGLGIWAVIVLKEVLIMLLVVFIFVAAVNPTIGRLQKHVSRFLAVSLFYSLLGLLLVLLSYAILPRLITQINDLVRSAPLIIGKWSPYLDSLRVGNNLTVLDQAVNAASSGLDGFSRNLYNTTLNFFGGLATVLTGLVLSFYLLLEEKNAREFFHQVLPHHRFEAVYKTVSKISERMGHWVRGQVLLMLIIGFSNLVVYLFIRLPSPLPLAIWAGLCEVIPYVGPALGVIPAIIVALATGSILQAILVFVIGYLLIQQLEAHLVVPKVMGKAVGLSPVLVILAMLIGVKLFGLVGALVAVPAAAIISVVVGEWASLRKIWESSSP